MARYSGVIGYADEVTTAPGVTEHVITEVSYRGDVVRNFGRNEGSEHLHDDLVVNNSVSVVADERAIKHFHKIKYISFEGERWTVSAVEHRPPRLILNLGRPYNGPTP